MKKDYNNDKLSYIKLIIGFCLILTPPLFAASWKIDSTLKFNYAYYKSLMKGNKVGKALNYTAVNQPDISNIPLSGLLNLKFPIKIHKNITIKNKTFYLKFYTFPKSLNAKNAILHIRDDFLLTEFKPFNRIVRYASQRKNNVVKVGFIAKNNTVFSSTHPFPAFRIKKNDNEEFIEKVPFVSLYLLPAHSKPKNFKENHGVISWNITGVQYIHKQLQKFYSSHLKHLYSDAKNDYYIKTYKKTIVLITLPKKILIFDKSAWKNLPMPQAKNMYLSSLLLLYYAKYKLHHKDNITYQKLKTMHPKERKVFEIPSVFTS